MRKGTPIFTKGLQYKLRKEQQEERERKARQQNQGEQLQTSDANLSASDNSLQGQNVGLKRNTSNPTFPLIKDFDEEVHVGEYVRKSHNNLQAYEQQQALLDETKPKESDSKSLSEEEKESKNNRALLICFVLIVIVGALNKILQKLQTVPMENYGNFMNLYMTFCYIPLSFLYVWPMYKYGYIKKEELEAPMKAYIVMGVLDGIAGIMQTFASIYIPGSQLVLLQQSAIPVSMIISKILIKVRYSPMQYVGALIVIGGILVVLGPTLFSKGNGSDDSGDSGDGDDASSSDSQSTPDSVYLMWCLIMIASCIPMTLSSVYKEIALVNNDLDPIYLNGMVAIFQFLISIPLAVPAAEAAKQPINEIPENLYQGFRCYIGKNSQDDDDCYFYAPLWVNLYILINVAYNILIICIVKYGSANVLWLAMTITVPIANITFSLPFMEKLGAYQPGDMLSYFGLIVIMIGLIAYRFGNAFYENLVERCSTNKDIYQVNKDQQGGMYEPLTAKDETDEEYQQMRSKLKRTESC